MTRFETSVPGEASQFARRKAQYGHRSWCVWRMKNGSVCAARVSPEVVKEALLAVGTQGRFTFYSASDSIPTSVGWRIGINILSNVKGGWIK